MNLIQSEQGSSILTELEDTSDLQQKDISQQEEMWHEVYDDAVAKIGDKESEFFIQIGAPKNRIKQEIQVLKQLKNTKSPVTPQEKNAKENATMIK